MMFVRRHARATGQPIDRRRNPNRSRTGGPAGGQANAKRAELSDTRAAASPAISNRLDSRPVRSCSISYEDSGQLSREAGEHAGSAPQ